MFASKGAVSYSVEVQHDEKGYLALFPALPDCEARGKTFEEALMNAEQELLRYIDTHIQIGIPFIEEELEVSSTLSITIKLPIISSIEASEKFGITNDYVTQLARRKLVRGFQIGRQWFVNERSLGLYLQKIRAENHAKRKALGERIKKELAKK